MPLSASVTDQNAVTERSNIDYFSNKETLLVFTVLFLITVLFDIRGTLVLS